MSQPPVDPVQELNALLQELESFAPRSEQAAGTAVVYRSVPADETLDDSPPSAGPEGTDDAFELVPPDQQLGPIPATSPAPVNTTVAVTDFQIGQGGPVAGVDCGIVRLGETENGLVIALRATIMLDDGTNTSIMQFRTGPIYLHNDYKKEILYSMGQQLGRDDFFVEVDRSSGTQPTVLRVKRGVADDAHQYGDRFRNWLERLIQRIASTTVQNGTILLDGALTLRTRDTPRSYLENLGSIASASGNAIVAVSKQSLLQVQGRPVRFWLDDVRNRACYRCLTQVMRREGNERVLGNAYAARFSPLGPTFRMDIKAVNGQTDDEAIERFFSSVLMRVGYPDLLVCAHAHSYFTSPDVVQLQAQAGAMYSLVPQGEVPLTGIFAPFGGRFK